MVVLEGNGGDGQPISADEEPKLETKLSSPLALEIFRVTKDAQQQHGLRHGDYQRYRGYCSRRLRRLRKVLKIPQGDRRHYRRRDVTATHLTGSNSESRLLCVPLLQAERAWAHAMQLRQEANTEPRKRFHLVSRLRKACTHAQMLLQLCEQSGACDARTQLEAGAYAAWLGGALLLELQQWRPAAESLTRAQLVLEKLSAALPEEERLLYKQKVEELKPSLRYCAYNIGDESAAGDLVAMRGQGLIENLDTLMAQAKESRSGVMHEVEWRGRRVTVRPEKVRLFLIALQDLDKSVASAQSVQAKIDVLENVLMDCKDAITAIKDEIKNDPKLKTATENQQLSSINYLLSYLMYLRLVRTIERNNLLVQQAEEARKYNVQIDGKKVRPQDLTRLYEIILQNYVELQQLPGFENDAGYQKEIENELKAYRAFRCYYIAQVLTGLRRFREALAMLERCSIYTTESLASKLLDNQLLEKLRVLQKDIESCKFEVHADSVLEDDDEDEESKFTSGKSYKDKKPLVDRLDDYREESQVLTKNPNIFKMPPPMEAVPCKPLFFDLACNFIEFPNLDDKTGVANNKKQGAGITGLVKGFLGWGKSDK
ncbi:signal recognition particle subunit SRP68 [Pararge aegeria]|uniref:Signal recognition particle subunit SRP68 n=2 Tax=Pararge aegeria TaxID=116150 RepID=A0A8S4SP06_9NEOP|nr:signal recognition particle subunit SRP68 [Pararge aegeria]CAH2268993.1 jg16017 [Pararge aegeria aegeria]